MIYLFFMFIKSTTQLVGLRIHHLHPLLRVKPLKVFSV